jgi:quinoprotein glucose dehydrogenase
MRFLLPLALLCSACLLAAPPVQEPDLPDGTERGLKQIPTFRIPTGMKVELFAAEPMLGSPVAIGVDEKNRVFVAEEYRFNRGTQENRNNAALQTLYFLEDDLQIKSLADRRKVFEKWAHKFPGGMEWYTKHGDKIRLLTDTKGVGKADKSSVFAGPFNDTLDGLAAGVMAHNGKVYVTCIPSLYEFQDTKNTGTADVKKTLHTGFGVNMAFLGHDLHGLTFGPDGKLYFSVGDRGFDVKGQEGQQLYGPRTGGVFRCFPDGSELELVHKGLRNPQELAFDEHGNLFADDNNCDKGDHGRLVYVVEGGESGWNMAYQTIPPPYMTGPWFAERLWHVQHPGQAAYIVPPIGPIGSGPSGFLFTSGTSLADRYKNSFLMCNYVGNGGIEAFKVKPKGAGFEIHDYHDFFKPIRATDAEFGYDGKLYVSDFVDLDWTGKSMGGRIYTLFDPKKLNDPVVLETKKLFAEGFGKLTDDKLGELLYHADQRVRQRAQFALAERSEKGREVFQKVLAKREDNLASLHAIWGLGQLGRKLAGVAGLLVPHLSHPGAEVRAQAAKVIGELPSVAVPNDVLRCLETQIMLGTPREQYFAIQSIGKQNHHAGVPLMVEVLRKNANQDVYLRHSIVTALSRMKDEATLKKLASDESAAVRLAVVLVYRQWKDERLAKFLDDSDPLVRIEAARAIHDLPLANVQQQLADQLPKLLKNPISDGDALTRRAIHAAYRLGKPQGAKDILAVASSTNFNETIRSEALAALKEWANPPQRDRVTGFWRTINPRDSELPRQVVEAGFQELLARTSGKLQTEVLQLAVSLGVKADDKQFIEWAKDPKREARLRVASLSYLAQRNSPATAEVLALALKDQSPLLRAEARTLQIKREPKNAIALLQAVWTDDKSSTLERQQALADLAKLKNAEATLESWGEKLLQNKVSPELRVDVLEALKTAGTRKLVKLQQQYEATLPRDPVGKFQVSLVGGNAERGRDIFVNHTGAQCVRCHKIGDLGGNAGPELNKLVSRYPEKTREFILESIVMPSAKIASGYANVTLSLSDGRSLAGTLLEENKKTLTLQTPEGKKVTVNVEDIDSRTKPTSPMPAADRTLNFLEMRDLIEYLASLK